MPTGVTLVTERRKTKNALAGSAPERRSSVRSPASVRPLARGSASRLATPDVPLGLGLASVGSGLSRVASGPSRVRAPVHMYMYALTLARAAAGRPGVCRGGLGKHTARRAPARPARPSPRPNRPTPSPPTPAVLGGLRCSSSSRAQISMTQSPSSHVTARAGVCGWRLRDTASMRGPRQLRAHRARAPSSQRTSIFDE